MVLDQRTHPRVDRWLVGKNSLKFGCFCSILNWITWWQLRLQLRERNKGVSFVNIIRKTIAPAVELTYLPAKKFKTGLLSYQFSLPLTGQSASYNALIPAVLYRGCGALPDMASISARLDHLYGAYMDYTVRKKGEVQCVGFVSRFVDDQYTLEHEALLEPVATLMGDLICDPVLDNGAFLEAYVQGEQQNLLDTIAGIINDKRSYADVRLLQELCVGEAYAVSRYGTKEGVEVLEANGLYQTYRDLISTAKLEVMYCGSAPLARVQAAVASSLANLPRTQVNTHPIPTALHTMTGEAKIITEALDVTQGKLGMGFICKQNDPMALLLGNNMFGGSSNSKLFMNVREKLSLCYYASSTYHRDKGIITVSSGIEFDKFEAAHSEIQAQLQAVAKGDIADWEWEGARSAVKTAYTALEDSQMSLENFYLSQAISLRRETPAELIDQMLGVSREQVAQAMSQVALDTTYFLKGRA